MRSIGFTLLTLGCLLFGVAGKLAAQNKTCGTDELHQQMLQNPTYRQIVDQAEAGYQEYVSHSIPEGVTGVVRKIPVVFHFIQCSENPCVDEADALSQIEVLNEDYRRVPGTNGFGNGVDAEYEFCLATIDPNGCPTTGINHVIAPQWCHHLQTNAAQMKGLIQWDPHHYLNVWVPCTIETSTSNGQVIGYATFPYFLNTQPNLDGVVIHANFLGRAGDPQYLGRTTTHEVGHWLGLYHTFQDGCAGATANTCAAQGDRVCDTPQALEANFGCPNINSCTDSPTDNPDQIENYMDYSNGSCQNMFTAGQKVRMDYYTVGNGPRNYIWSAPNLAATGCDGTVSPGCIPQSNFEADNVITCVGVPVQFTDISLHAATSWSWTFPGGTPSTSTLQNPVVTYATPGDYDVTLVAGNGLGSGTEVKYQYIRATQPATSPLQQGFEGILVLPQDWMITDDQGIETWKLTSAAHSEGTHAMKVKNFESRNAGEKMALHSNSFSMQYFTSASITFDHSYKKFSGLTADKLSLEISTDCGATWTELWSKAGPYLATVAGSAATAEWVPTLSTHWKSDTVSLDSFAGQPNVKVKWVCTSANGQTIYLDNINMNVTMVSATDPKLPSWDFQVAPNPFHEDLRVQYILLRSDVMTFTVTDVSGKELSRVVTGRETAGAHTLDSGTLGLRALPAGVYFLKGVGTQNGAVTRKLVKVN